MTVFDHAPRPQPFTPTEVLPAMLKAVTIAPENLVLRPIAADAFQEADDTGRADYIRRALQSDDGDLTARELAQDLFQAYGRVWTGDLPPELAKRIIGWSGGFPCQVTLPPQRDQERFLNFVCDCTTVPGAPITDFRCNDSEANWVALFAALRSRARSMEIDRPQIDPQNDAERILELYRALFQTEFTSLTGLTVNFGMHAARLTGGTLPGEQDLLRNSTYDPLNRSVWANGLRQLALMGPLINGLARWAFDQTLPQLGDFTLRSSDLSPEDINHFLVAKWLPQVTRLDWQADLIPDELIALGQRLNVGLTRLKLNAGLINAEQETWDDFFGSPFAQGVAQISLLVSRMGAGDQVPVVIRALAAATLPGLRELELSGSHPRNVDREALAGLIGGEDRQARLHTLRLKDCGINEDALSAFNGKECPALRVLDLARNVGIASTTQLSSFPFSRNLRELAITLAYSGSAHSPLINDLCRSGLKNALKV
jgi:hypothetical protein